MRVRAAVLQDARPIAEAHVAAWLAAYRGLIPDSYLDELTVAKRVELWERRLSQPRPGGLLVAEAQGSLAGFCLFGPTRDEEAKGQPIGEIIALNVRPDCWRRGYGRALCERALSDAPRHGWTAMTLWILKGNARAARFYEELGFALDGSERLDQHVIGAPIYELRFRKDL
jgi:GNAT superfamily N-acetyltransferase